MLCLTRLVGQEIAIGADIRIIIQEIHGKQVRIAIEAPPDIDIFRSEIPIHKRRKRENP